MQLTEVQVAALGEAFQRYRGEASYQRGRARYFERYKTDRARQDAAKHRLWEEKYRQYAEAIADLLGHEEATT